MIHNDRRRAFLLASLLATALITGCSDSATPSQTAASLDESLDLEEGEQRIDQRTYMPLEIRTHTIKSNIPLLVGFRTNFSDEMKPLIQTHKNIFGREVSVAAELTASEPGSFAGSNDGGAVQAIPKDGMIEVRMQNHCRGPLEIVLYTEALTDEEVESLMGVSAS